MTPRRIPKPWGEEILFARTAAYAGKILRIRKGESLSLQYHEKKDETIYVYDGTLRLTLEVDGRQVERVMEAGEAVHFAPRTTHRLAGVTDCTLFEVSTPELEDVVRIEDRYGRV
jgi:mannose-6-phosphate isomerase